MAIDIKTLRIGNHVLLDGERVEIDEISISGQVGCITQDNDWRGVDANDRLDPIQLTPELVEELGFKKSEDANFPPYNLKGEYQDPQCKRFIQDCLENPELAKEFPNQKFCFLWHLENKEKQAIWKISCEKGSMEITYLHELENMYHYLTGREL